jgi:hypothetical protein
MFYDIFKSLLIVIITIPILSWTKILTTGWIQFLIFPLVGLLGGLISQYYISNVQIGLLVPCYFLYRAHLSRNLYDGFSQKYLPAILYFIAYFYPHIELIQSVR